jgi:ABC-type transport system involved in multi-copper enzyme maturation permease subunit
MVTITSSQTTSFSSECKRHLDIILKKQSLVLMRRQINMLFRIPMGFWLFGAALLLVSCGFIFQYGAYAQKTYTLSELSNLSNILGNILLNNYRLYTFITLFIMVPIIGVASIIQEREANTLDLVLTTGITPLEFIFSKVTSSLAVIIVALFATLPILASTLSLGGVSPWDIIIMLLSEIFIAFFGICIGIYMGALMPNLPIGLASSYAIMLAIMYPTWRMTAFGTDNENMFFLYPGIIAMILWSLLLIKSTPYLLIREVNKVKHKSWRPISIKGINAQLWTFLGTRNYLEPIRSTENPVYVLERERFLSGVTRRHFDAPSILWLVSIPLFYVALTKPAAMLQLENILVLCFVPSVAATMFSGEHERNSWESLRASLISTGQIFWGKIRLAIGQGLVHVYSFYIPALLVLGMIWFLASLQSTVSYYHPRNFFTVWMGNGLILISITFLVCFVASLSFYISSLFKRNLHSLLTSYIITFLFLYFPIFLSEMHPMPGEMFSGYLDKDILAYFLGIWHSPYIFNLWPKVGIGKIQNAINPLFWKLYIFHISFLALGSAILCRATWSRISRLTK